MLTSIIVLAILGWWRQRKGTQRMELPKWISNLFLLLGGFIMIFTAGIAVPQHWSFNQTAGSLLIGLVLGLLGAWGSAGRVALKLRIAFAVSVVMVVALVLLIFQTNR